MDDWRRALRASRRLASASDQRDEVLHKGRSLSAQTNAIILAACGSDERPCQVAVHRGQIKFGEIMARTPISDGFSCGYRRYNPCWIKASGEDGLGT